ncbi:U1 small nuclear ribonucleoprotein 70 kDa [Sardina pilchardus]|uniref:U1 small nuclear ribonucleoprotein 70 kDa n=1 Tax=Sardina pilchardus TaxID=27697 RepID=UPI002E112956
MAAGPAVTVTTMLVVVMVFVAPTCGMSNELDYGNWNYREGAESVDVTYVRSVTRVLDSWGKKIFNEIKTLLHSQPSALLPDYSRVRPLSESLNDLFREVLHLQRRITDLNHRLATLEPVLRRYGYRTRGEEEEEEEEEEDEEEEQQQQQQRRRQKEMMMGIEEGRGRERRRESGGGGGGGGGGGEGGNRVPLASRGGGYPRGGGAGGASLVPRQPTRRYTVRTVRPVRRVVRTRRVRVYKDKDGNVRVLESDAGER